ncbi:translation initiation factor IF-2 [Anolis carolinensis]|uniref:translation initiation factor IF-2 n=1 Tax=Anolis carolinensis TaxID=28377 RepID=UPI002F2B1F1D
MESPGKEASTRSRRSPSPPPRSFFPETPGDYRSAFAEECEAIAQRLAAAAAANPTPLRTLRLPSTVEAERLTPLWKSFIESETFTHTPPPSPSNPNRTFCVEASACSLDLHRTFEWEAAPLVTSTPAPQTGEVTSGSSLPFEERKGSPRAKKRRLSPGGSPPRCQAPEGAALGGKGAPRKASGGGPKKEEGARVTRPRLGKKQLPSGMKNKVLQEKKSAPLTQLRLVACQGPKLQGNNKPSRSKLPVPEGLDGRRIDGAMVAAGQIPRDAPGCASCLQCQRLLKENQRLAQENQRLAQENQRLAQEKQQLKNRLENIEGGNTS